MVLGACKADENESPATTSSTTNVTTTTTTVTTTSPTTTVVPTTPTVAADKPVYGGVYKYAAPSWISSMNVLLGGQAQDGYFSGVFNHSIMGMDESQKPVPYAAESWEWKDPTTFVMKLRNDVFFTDGTKFNADSVVYTYEFGKNSDNKALYMNFYKTVTATKIDAYTVQFKTDKPVNWPGQLVGYAGNMLSKETMDKWGVEYTKHPSGIGAFHVTDMVTGSSMTAVRSSTFFLKDADGNSMPYLNGINVLVIPDPAVQLAAIKAGQLDYCYPPLQEVNSLKMNPNFKVYTGPSATIWTVMFNKNVKPMDDVRVRKAFYLAIDRQAIVDGLYFGNARACASLYPPELWYHNPALKVIPQDLEQAKQLLVEAGYPNGFEMTMLCLNDTMTVARSEAIQAQVKAIGINVKVEPMEPASAMARRNKKDWQSVNHNWTAMADPQIPLDGWYLPEAAYGFDHALYDDVIPLIRQSAVEFLDQNKRQQLYWDIEQKLYDNYAHGWYMSPNNLAVVKKNLMNYGVGIGNLKYVNWVYWFAK